MLRDEQPRLACVGTAWLVEQKDQCASNQHRGAHARKYTAHCLCGPGAVGAGRITGRRTTAGLDVVVAKARPANEATSGERQGAAANDQRQRQHVARRHLGLGLLFGCGLGRWRWRLICRARDLWCLRRHGLVFGTALHVDDGGFDGRTLRRLWIYAQEVAIELQR
jgi:hypothetical protein